MKRYSFFLPAILLPITAVLGQVTSSSEQALAGSDLVQQVGAPGDGVYAITETAQNHRRWSKITSVPLEDGSFQTSTNSFVEMATGLNRLDPQNRWVPAEAKFELIKGAAVARYTGHYVTLAGPTDRVPVEVLLPGGHGRLSCRVLGIAYYSPTSGKNILVAQPKPTQGVLLGREVLYPDCFDGGFKASLRYTLSLAGLAQDVIIESQPPAPTELGFAPNERVHLQVITEFLNAPAPSITPRTIRSEPDPVLRQQMREPDRTDEFLDFGSMQMWPGKAFDLGAASPMSGPLVLKHWEVIDGRNILFEEIPWDEAAPLLLSLPSDPQASTRSKAQHHLARSRQELVSRLQPVASEKPTALILAESPSPALEKGMVLDWSLFQSTAELTLQADNTYYVTDLVIVSQKLTVEGGAVIKAIPFDSNYDRKIYTAGQFICQTSGTRMAIFTARDDDTVGEVLPDSQHSISPGQYYINWISSLNGDPITLSNLRFCYSIIGAALWGGSGFAVEHCQFVNCSIALQVCYGAATVRNVLIYNVSHALNGNFGSVFRAEHLTVDQANLLNANGGDPSVNQCYLTNCLVTQVAATNTFSGEGNVVLSSSSGIYAPVGAGKHYLSANSSYRNCATPNINPKLALELRRRTTYPPILLANDFTSPTVLGPQAQRDVDQADIGYHYAPLDYCLSGLNLTNTTLVLTNGVALAAYGSKGITLRSGAHFISEGTAKSLNRLVRYNSVQETPTVWGTSSSSSSLLDVSNATPEIRLRFSEVSLLANSIDNRYFVLSSGAALKPLAISDSQLAGVRLDIYSTSGTGMSVNLTNNLFERSHLRFYQRTTGGYSPFTLNVYNQTFYGGTNLFDYRDTSTIWTIRDSLFNSNRVSGGSQIFLNSYNGYFNSSMLPGGNSNLIVTNASYQIGPLGPYYYPNTIVPGTLGMLINAGSRSASSAGLSEHTTTTNQVKEGTGTVDVGFHYLALVNTPPVANNDVATVMEGGSVSVLSSGSNTVLANDMDVDEPPNPLQARLETAPSHGLVTLNLDGTFLYTHNGSETTADSFTYKVNDGSVDGNTATVLITVSPVNDPPTVALPGGPASYTENGPPMILDSAATLTDADSIDFNGGSLSATLISHGTADDRLGINHQGTATGQIGVSGPNVTYGGVVIGTLAGGTNLAPLVVSFNANATPTSVQALVRNLTFENVSEIPSTMAREMSVVVTDGDGGTSALAGKQISVTGVPDWLLINMSAGVLNYSENDPPIFLDPNAGVSDPDQTGFVAQTITVGFESNGTADDRLDIYNHGWDIPGQVTCWGNTLRFGGQNIGAWVGGTGTTPLVVNLSTNVAISTIQVIVRNLRYWSVSDNPSEAQRLIRVVATDTSGHASSTAHVRVDVHRVIDPPTLSFSQTEANNVQNGVILIDPGATVTDPDSSSFAGGTLTLECIANGIVTDRWSIRNEGSAIGQIGFSGSTVTYGGQVIGTVSGGSGTAPLVITFNSNSSPTAAEALVRNLTYGTTLGTFDGIARTVRVTVIDGSSATAPLLRDLAAYWSLDEASGTRVDSVGGLNLTDNNHVGQAAGKLGNAALFRRSQKQYLSHSDCPELAIPTDSWTYAAWIYLDSRIDRQAVFAKNDGSNLGGFELCYDSANSAWACSDPGDKIACNWQPPGWTDGYYSGWMSRPLSIDLGQWYFVVLWLDEPSQALGRSVNDEVDVLYSAAQKVKNEPGEFTIGAILTQTYGIWNAFDGRIDEVGFWRRALTTAERSALYNIGMGRPFPLALNSATKLINNGDPDADLLSNTQESVLGTNPLLADTNGNGTNDGEEDFDDDGLPNKVEVALGTNCLLRDSNGNGAEDGAEDADGDLLPNGAEVNTYHSNPLDAYSLARAASGSSQSSTIVPLEQTGTVAAQAGDSEPAILLPPIFTTDGRVQVPDQLTPGGMSSVDLTVNSSTAPASLSQTALPTDSQHVFAADAGNQTFKAYLSAQPVNGKIRLTLTGGEPGKAYDIYLRRALTPLDAGQVLYYHGAPGQTVFDVPIPTGPEGYFTAGLGEDTDRDGLPDAYEVLVTHTSPLQSDTGPIGITDPARDPDGDSLTNIQEYQLGTDPRLSDTDADGTTDGNDDFDGDGLTNWQEYNSSSNPADLIIRIARPASGTNIP